MATVLELRKAGYSEEEIASWLNTERDIFIGCCQFTNSNIMSLYVS